MKEETLLIQGPITPAYCEALYGQIAGLGLEEGDMLNVMIDSEGGYVDSAFLLASGLEALQKAGIRCIGIAAGKVWSSALLPFLACYQRVVGEAGSFLIHRVAVQIEKDATLEANDLCALQNGIWEDTDLICSFYRAHGVKEEAVRHLYEDDDLIVSNELEALGLGLITKSEIVSTPINFRMKNVLGTWRASKRLVHKATSNIINLKSDLEMNDETTKELANLKNEIGGLKAGLNELINAVRSLNADGEGKTKVEPMNESEDLTDEEAKEVGKHMRKTPCEIVGQEGIKWLAHPGEDVERDHYVVPIDKDGKAVMLAEGDYETKVDGEDFMIHSTGKDAYLHSRGSENKAKNEGEDATKIEEENKKKNEVPTIKLETKAPTTNQKKTTTPNPIQRQWELAMKHSGRSGVGYAPKK